MNDPIDYCECQAAPEKHVHILNQGELDEARRRYPHIWVIHEFGCTCLVHGILLNDGTSCDVV